MKRCLSALILILILSVPAFAKEELPPLEKILDRYIEALGGREAIAELETRVITGRQIDDRPYRGPAVESEMKVWADAAGNWTRFLQTPEGEFREGCAGGKNWKTEPGGEVVPNDYRHTKLAYLFNPQGPLMIEEYFPNLKVTGTWDYDGVEYYKVENDLKFEYYTLYFEVETGMLTRIGYHWRIEGHHEVDGVMVPAVIFQGRKGGSTNLYFDEVGHGGEVADHLQSGGK